MRLTKQQAVEEHRKMWNWIADQLETGQNIKDVASLKEKYCMSNDFHITHNCFCCEYNKRFNSIYDCDYCPLIWGTESKVNDYYCELGLKAYEYNIKNDDEEACLWIIADNYAESGEYKKAAEYARKIANLSERPNYEKDILE